MLIIEIKLMPNAVFNALLKLNFCLNKINVSKIILVIKELIMAKIIILKTGKGIFVIWKKNIVPKSPIEQPNKHQAVFFALLFHVAVQCQLKDKLSDFKIKYLIIFKKFTRYLIKQML